MQTRHARPLLNLRFAALSMLALAGPLACASVAASSLEVEVHEAKNADGRVICGLYDSAETFRKPGLQLAEATSTITDGKAHCRFPQVAPGRYAVAAFHAEQGELQPSYGFLGKPKQGVAFTNNPSITFGPPRFDDAAIDVGAESLRVMITLKY